MFERTDRIQSFGGFYNFNILVLGGFWMIDIPDYILS
jgi:hypothetical protein